MFSADFTSFTHVSTGEQTIRTLEYSIPAELKGHIELVHPTISFPDFNVASPVFSSPVKNSDFVENAKRAVPSSCASTITPTCLQDLYGIPT
jgi:tripeptidyl-peptidase-1